MKLTFGGGTGSAEDQLREFTNSGTLPTIQNFLNNFSLGSTLKPNTTLFIQYRSGGGVGSNIGVNTINQVGTVIFVVNGPSETTNNAVINSLRCNNVTAAIGGAGQPTLEEVRNYVGFNFASQNRAVTVNDYEALIRKMPSQFGAPAKVAVMEEENKIKVKILSYDTGGALTNTVSNALLDNLATYLSNFRMINDYIAIETADVVDLSLDVYVVLESTQNQGNIITSIIDKISNYFSPANRELGQNVNISEINRILQSENGVISVTQIDIFNEIGGEYSSSQTSMAYADSATKLIAPQDGTIFALPNQVYQVRFPTKDIRVRVKNFQSVTLS